MEQNPYAAPSSHADSPAMEESHGPLPWFAVGQNKLMVMALCTGGLYVVYWFERQFRFQKQALGERSWPLARGLFSIFFAHDLFRRIQIAARYLEIRASWSAKSQATTFVVCAILARIADRASAKLTSGTTSLVLSLLGILFVALFTLPLVKVQGTVNEILERTQPNFVRNERFSVWNWLVIALGVTVLALAALGSLIPDEQRY